MANCLEKKFVVFATTIDLKGHIACQHPEFHKGHQRSQTRHVLSIDVTKPTDTRKTETLASSNLSTNQPSTPFTLAEEYFPSLSTTVTTNHIVQKKPVVSREDKFPSLSSFKSFPSLPLPISSLPLKNGSTLAHMQQGKTSGSMRKDPTLVPIKPNTLTHVVPQESSLIPSKIEKFSDIFPELPKNSSNSTLSSSPINSHPPPGLKILTHRVQESKKPLSGKLRVLRLV